VSTIDSGHLEVGDGGEEGSQEAALVLRREALDLRADIDAGGFGCSGCTTLFNECEPDFQIAESPQINSRSARACSGWRSP
jgi:hypothetical protein